MNLLKGRETRFRRGRTQVKGEKVLERNQRETRAEERRRDLNFKLPPQIFCFQWD